MIVFMTSDHILVANDYAVFSAAMFSFTSIFRQRKPSCLETGKFLCEFYISHPADWRFNAINQRFWLQHFKEADLLHPDQPHDSHLVKPSSSSRSYAIKTTWSLPRSIFTCFTRIHSSMARSILLQSRIVRPVIALDKRTGRSWQIIAICFKTQYRVLMFQLTPFMLITESMSAVLLVIRTCLIICFIIIVMMKSHCSAALLTIVPIHCLVVPQCNFINVHTRFPLTKGLWSLYCIPPISFWLHFGRSFYLEC